MYNGESEMVYIHKYALYPRNNRKGILANNSADKLCNTIAEYPPAPSIGTTPRERMVWLIYRENLTHRELAKIGKTTVSSISHIVNGKCRTISSDTTRAMGKYFDLPHWFFNAYDSLPDNTPGEKLKKARMYRLLSLADASRFFNVSVKTYLNWERNKFKGKYPSAQKLTEWIDAIKKGTV